MDKFLIRNLPAKQILPIQESDDFNTEYSSKRSHIEANLNNCHLCPTPRIQILDFPSNIWDEVRRAYLQKDLVSLECHNFLKTKMGNYNRKFNLAWFNEFSDC